LAGHSQISIWRNWQQRDRSRLPLILNRDRPSGKPNLLSETGFALNEQDRQLAETLVAQPISAQTRLILPTSLCSGQIAGLAVTKLNEQDLPNGSRRRPFATLVHTEGCGVAFKSTQEVYAQTMIGYATHPLVADCLFLEHGCEKAHNDYLKALIREAGRSTDEFGWASVQMDGGIARVIAGIETYFTAQAANTDAGPARSTFNLAIVSEGEVPTGVATSFARLTRQLVHAGGTLVMPGNGGFAQSPEFWAELNMDGAPAPTLAYGQATRMAGLHIMERPTPHWTETITGLGATGAQVIVGYTDKPRAGHPFVPVLLVTAGQTQHDADLRLEGAAATWPSQILESVAAVNSGEMEPKTVAGSHTDFQLTRGWLGIST
jgi:hypothetical protein